MILELLDVENSDSRLKTVIEIFLATKAVKTLTDNKKQQRDELHKLIMGPGNSYIWFLAWLISWFLEQKNKQRKNKRQMYENCTRYRNATTHIANLLNLGGIWMSCDHNDKIYESILQCRIEQVLYCFSVFLFIDLIILTGYHACFSCLL